MSRVKLCVLGALAMLIISVVAVSSASAVVFKLESIKCEGTVVTLCWEAETGGVGLQELKGEQSFTAKLDLHEPTEEHLLEATLGESVVHIECEETNAEGTIFQLKPLEATPTLKGKVTFEKCKLLEPLSLKCTVDETIVTSEIEGTMPGTEEEVLFKPAVGKVFTEIGFGGAACPATVKGKQPVTGEQICLWDKATTDEKEKLLFCPTEDSKLKLGGSPAVLLDSLEVALTGLGDLWDITLG